MTTFYSIRLEKAQCFSTSKKAVRAAFADVPLNFVSFGLFSRHHRWDYRVQHPPELHGWAVAALTISPMEKPYLSLYPIATSIYTNKAREDFNNNILARLRDWAIDRLNKPETAPEGYEEIVVEWTGTKHNLHSVRFQTGLERRRPTPAPADAPPRNA